MKKYFIFRLILLLLFAVYSCKKEIKSEKGGIDIVSNVYFNASKSLDNVKSFHVSRLNYSNDTIVEIVPDLNFPEINQSVFLIKDTLYYNLGKESSNQTLISEILKNQKPKSVFNKKIGAIFSKDEIPNYRNRRKLSDTLLFKKKYRRFEINSPWNYTRFYVFPTDTILPYSIYKNAEKDFCGRIERIDLYNKKTDVFVTLQLLPRKNWDKEAEDFFEFNQFVKNRKNDRK